jgi:ABC-type lipoprotein release transport system permease subunit
MGPARAMSWISKGRKIGAPGEAVVEGHYAKFNKITVGDTVSFDRHRLTIVGIVTLREGATVAAANYYVSLDDARMFGSLEGAAANMLFIRLQKGVDPAGLQERVPTLLPGGVAMTTDSIGGMMKGFAGISDAVSLLLGWGVLAFAVVLSCWLIAGSLNEQSLHIGLMKTVGWRKRDILTAFAAETLLLGIVGALAGIGLGYAITFAVSHAGVILTLPWNLSAAPGLPGHLQHEGERMVLPVVLQTGTCLTTLATACFSAVLTGIITALHIAGMKVRRAFDWS